MNSKTFRLREFIPPVDGRSLIVDASAGLAQGALPGLEDFSTAANAALPHVDGLITSPGMARRLTDRTRDDAALLVRIDWTNALRGEEFVLPLETINHIRLLSPQDALDLGASALVTTFLLGHEEQIEANCLKTTVQLALEGTRIGMPLIVDVQPVGPRVRHFNKAVELGVSYALEGGADGVAIPWPGVDSLETVLTMAAEVPIWIQAHSDDLPAGALEMGAAGLWLGVEVFAHEDAAQTLEAVRQTVHSGPQVVED